MATLENIAVFVRAFELGSFSAAGRSLRMSSAVVSYRIQCLEEHLGCRLFNRTTRRLSPTENGRVFYESSLEIRDAVERAEARVSNAGAAPHGVLKVTAPLGLGRRLVAPLVPRFRIEHPEIDVRLRLSDYIVDLLTEAVDVAVRMAVLADSSLIVRKIADVERVLCAAPSYLAKRGQPKSIEDLDRHECLLLRFPGSQQFRWPLRRGRRVVSVAVRGHLEADDGDVLTDWALAGEGIVMKPAFEVTDHLRAGSLVTVLPRHQPVPATLAVLHAYRRMVPPKVRAFADFTARGAREAIDMGIAGFAPYADRGAHDAES
ncbi:MAG: LysR family transcriptional regulator [Alphaproteobacteria bacterium]|nr:LysR family transcriptional regulator [Alphaproteobacteria bacterium]